MPVITPSSHAVAACPPAPSTNALCPISFSFSQVLYLRPYRRIMKIEGPNVMLKVLAKDSTHSSPWMELLSIDAIRFFASYRLFAPSPGEQLQSTLAGSPFTGLKQRTQ